MTKLKRFINKHTVFTYFLLAYAITWSVWTPISYSYVNGSLKLSPPIVLLYIAGSFGPFLSAVIVTTLCGGNLRALHSQLLKWRVSANRKTDLGKHNSVIVDKSLEESSA